MTRNEKRLLSALKDMVESYDVAADYWKSNKEISKNLERFFNWYEIK